MDSAVAQNDSSDPNGGNLSRNVEAAAGILGLQLHVLHASSERDFDAVFTKLRKLRARALVIAGDAVFSSIAGREQLGALASRHAVPTIFENREFASAGGL
jgi:putative ABC transport system substrate-binding protein